MAETINTTVSIQKTLSDQAETLAQHLNISRSHLFKMVIENFIKNYQSPLLDEINKEDQSNAQEQTELLSQNAKTGAQIGEGRKVINQGDIYWAQIDKQDGMEPGYSHPHVVIQDNVFNRSRLNTVVVCALTSNIKRANEPGNVLLEIIVTQMSGHGFTIIGHYRCHANGSQPEIPQVTLKKCLSYVIITR